MSKRGILTLPSGQELPDNEANRAFKRLVEQEMHEEQKTEIEVGVPTVDEYKGANPIPQLPEDVWQGPFADYRELVADTTEAPDSYHYAVCATVLGATLGRRIWVNYGHPVFPNMYVCMVGTSALARKGTAWRRGQDILNRLHFQPEASQEESNLQIIPGIGSAEGLLDALNGKRRVVVLSEEEFSSLLGKARQEGLSNLIPKLTSLFDCHGVETLQTRQKKVTAVEPFVSIITGTTEAWLERYLTQSDIYGGFANRFVYVGGHPKPPMAFPKRVDRTKEEQLTEGLNDIRLWAEYVRQSSSEGEVVPTEEATRLFEDYYAENYRRSMAETLQGVLIRRLPLYVWKLALLYAAAGKSERIEAMRLEPAILAAKFLEQSVRAVFCDFGSGKTVKLERKIKALLEEAGGALPKRELYRTLGISASYFDQMASSMTKAGEVEPSEFVVRGRSVKGLQLVPERRVQ